MGLSSNALRVSTFVLLCLMFAVEAGPSSEWGRIGAPADTAQRKAVNEYISRRLELWRERLELSDWDITLEFVRQSALKPNTLGNIHWDMPTRTAHIRVLDLEDYRRPYRDALADMEFTVVHEMIHLELASMPRSDASRRDEEHAVNRIADALLALDRPARVQKN